MGSAFCDKESFIDYKDGRDRLIHLNKKGRHKYRLYKCHLCGNFHITTITKNLNTPKKIDKYPIKVEPPKKEKKVVLPPIISPVSKPADNHATGKMMTKEQRLMLMKLVEQKNKQ